MYVSNKSHDTKMKWDMLQWWFEVRPGGVVQVFKGPQDEGQLRGLQGGSKGANKVGQNVQHVVGGLVFQAGTAVE